MIQLLNAEGIEAPLLVETGEQALDVVATQPPVDVIIVGEYIGRLDQIAFCEALRLGATVSSQPPIVGVVGSVTDSYLNQLLGAGMNAFISKPVTADRVREILGRYSS
jgi:CheY-like chemotaxis protein